MVDLPGFGVLGDQTTFGLTVVDLSYDGCKIRSDLALFPGLQLRLSIKGICGALDAIVRWYSSGKGGLQFLLDDSPSAAKYIPREHDRQSVAADISLRRPGRGSYFTRTFDLTPRGCKVEFVERPRLGESIWVKLDGLDAITATVRWVDDYYGGLEFVRPIYPVVFDMLLARLGVARGSQPGT
ncbi:MAG TPA: PilZ domain-containing protein [Sphingomicrobium sp.]